MKKVTLVVKNGRNHMCVCVCIYVYICLCMQPTPVLLTGKFHGRRSLVGYSPWGCKDSDNTKQLHFLSYVLYICICVLCMYMWHVYVCMCIRMVCVCLCEICGCALVYVHLCLYMCVHGYVGAYVCVCVKDLKQASWSL